MYDNGGYLIATPSMIKRTEEEKIRLRKLKEMGAKIDEETNIDSEKEDDVEMEYSDVAGNSPVNSDSGVKPSEVGVEKPYLRLLDVRPSVRESKL